MLTITSISSSEYGSPLTVAVEADWSSCRRRHRLVLLPEKHTPVHQPIDIAEAATLAQIQTGNGERLIGGAEQLDRVFVARVELEFAVQSVTGSGAPNSQVQNRSTVISA